MESKANPSKKNENRYFTLWILWIDEISDSDEAEIIYEEIEVIDDENSDSLASDEEIEYIYEEEYTEEEDSQEESDEESKQTEDKNKQSSFISSKELSKSCRLGEKSPPPILLRNPPVFRKSVSFSSVHSVLTEDNDVIYVDEEDDIFSWNFNSFEFISLNVIELYVY